MKKIINKIIWTLNGNTITREILMIPIIFMRDKIIDLKNIKFILAGQKRLKKYKDIHKGERCFVIGNGPSLTASDLDLIQNEYSFGSNRIYDIYSRTNWRPTYYGVQDLYVLKEISKEIEDSEDAAKARFIVSNRPKFICDEMKKNKKNEFFYLGTRLSENRKIRISSDFSKIVKHGGTITYALIQLAIYMGFTEIYLLGVDHNYQNFQSQTGEYNKEAHMASHFEGAREYKNLKMSNVPLKKGPVYISTKAYRSAREYAENAGIKIYNATRGGKLEVFERVNLDEIID